MSSSPKSIPPRWVLASLSLSILLSSLGTSIANVGLPVLAQAFDASFRQVQWVVLAYLLAVTALVVNAGRLGDVFGRRRVLLAGIAVFSLASLLCGLAPSLAWLVAARALQGFGAAMMMALAMALVGESVPREQSGSAMGLLGTMSAAGTALGPTLGGALIAGFGWPAIFFVNAPLGVLAFALVRCFLPADDPSRTAGGNRASLVSQLRAAFRDRPLRASLAASVIVMMVMMATLVVGPFYLSQGLGLAAAQVGLAMSAGPVVAALSGVPAGRMVDRFGAQRVLRAGLAGMAAGALLLATLPAALGVAGYVAPLCVITAGFGVFQAANNTAVMASAGAQQRGVVSGLLNLSRNLGLIAGASAMGAVYAQALNAASGLHATFAVSVALIATAVMLLWTSN